MNLEYEALLHHGTYVLVSLPIDANLVHVARGWLKLIALTLLRHSLIWFA